MKKDDVTIETILQPSQFKTPEHVGGYNWTMLHGDTIAIAKPFWQEYSYNFRTN